MGYRSCTTIDQQFYDSLETCHFSHLLVDTSLTSICSIEISQQTQKRLSPYYSPLKDDFRNLESRIFKRVCLQMAQLGFLLPDEMQQLFDVYAASRGGRSAALRALVAKALADEGHCLAPLPGPRISDDGNAGGVTIRLSGADWSRLDEERRAMGMTRGQWLLSCARHRLHGSRHFGQVDRERIAKIVGEMRHIKMILFRYAGALERSPKDIALVEKHHGLIAHLSHEIARALRAIEGSFQGNDGYWREEPLPTHLTTEGAMRAEGTATERSAPASAR